MLVNYLDSISVFPIFISSIKVILNFMLYNLILLIILYLGLLFSEKCI